MTELYWHQHAVLPILSILQLAPLVGAGVLVRMGEHPRSVLVGRVFIVAELVLAVVLYLGLDVRSPAFQYAEWLGLLPTLAYHVGADGVTVLFVMLTALMAVLLSVYGLARELDRPGRLLAVILALEAVTISQLVTLNLIWFVLASAVEVFLIGYLLWYWATSPEKDLMVARFYQFQGTGVLLMLMGALMIGWNHADATGQWSFDLLDLSKVPVKGVLGSVVFFLLFYGLGVRTPIFPLHGWLPIVAQHGNIAVAPALLIGIKIGIYGLVRFVLPTLHSAVVDWHQFVVGFAAAGVFYAALLAFVQTDLRKLLAFAVVSHTGLLIIGLFSLHPLGFQGSLLLAVNFGLAVTAMLFMTGFVYRRSHTTALDKLGGLFDRIPFIGLTFLIGGLAIVGMPGTPGFDAAHLVLEASIEKFGALPTVAAALGNVAAAGFLLYAFQRAFLAPRPASQGAAVERTNSMEYLIALVVVTVLLTAGFYLEPWLQLIEVALNALAGQYHAGGLHG